MIFRRHHQGVLEICKTCRVEGFAEGVLATLGMQIIALFCVVGVFWLWL